MKPRKQLLLFGFQGGGSIRMKPDDRINKNWLIEAGPKRSKLSDLDCGQGDLGSNPGESMCFFGMVN